METKRTCYIISGAGAETSRLRDLLRLLSVEAVSPELTSPVGQSNPITLRTALRKANFVIGLVGQGRDQANVLFEIGVAAGVNKAIFLIVEPAYNLNFALQSYPQVRTLLEDVETIEFHLKFFLRNIGKGRIPAASPAAARPRGLHSFGGAIESPLIEHSQLERRVRNALNEAGFRATSQPAFVSDGRTFRPDFVLWADVAPASLGNPIIIEVKGQLHSYEPAVDQVRKYLRAANLRTALLVSGGPIDLSLEQTDSGYIFILSVDRFLSELQSGSLFQTLVRERNIAAHGRSP